MLYGVLFFLIFWIVLLFYSLLDCAVSKLVSAVFFLSVLCFIAFVVISDGILTA